MPVDITMAKVDLCYGKSTTCSISKDDLHDVNKKRTLVLEYETFLFYNTSLINNHNAVSRKL